MRLSKNLPVLLLCAALLLGLFPAAGVTAAAADGVTYYVDSAAGDDANSGTSENEAWKTLQKASSVTYGAGDRILLKRGGYFQGGFSAKGSGSADAPVTLSVYGEGAMPVITNAPDDPQCRPVLEFVDVSHWTATDLELNAPNGTGVYIAFNGEMVEDITVDSLVIHNIQNYPSDDYYAGQRAAVRIMGNSGAKYIYAKDINILNCEIYDCGYGIFTSSHFYDESPNCEEYPYSKDILVDGCSIHDLYDDGIIIAQVERMVVRNTSVINTTQSNGIYFTAPTWMWGATNCVVENCEIAGAKNLKDGMACDFDDHTDNSVYQYVYSHDNVRFMHNCPFNDDHYNNTVRYCLSVNDNLTRNGAGRGDDIPERNFKFYNNTIINGGEYFFDRFEDSYICNNIFCLQPGQTIHHLKNRNNVVSNNCYYGVFLSTCQDSSPVRADPRFAGSALDDPDSFVLLSSSPCIGAGVAVEDDMGERDFYGNPLTETHNIGCYEGGGAEGEYRRDIFAYIRMFFRALIFWIGGTFR